MPSPKFETWNNLSNIATSFLGEIAAFYRKATSIIDTSHDRRKIPKETGHVEDEHEFDLLIVLKFRFPVKINYSLIDLFTYFSFYR